MTASQIMNIIEIAAWVLVSVGAIIFAIVGKNKTQVITTITDIVKDAVAQAEKTGESGDKKKEIALAVVKSALAEKGIDADKYSSLIDAAIEGFISAVNKVVK